jgi:hypothetical protein
MAQALWEKRGTEWPHISLGLILGCRQVTFPKNEEDIQANGEDYSAGASRLFRIIVSESAHLIWLLRNERVIQHNNQRQPHPSEIRNRWMSAINARLQIDRRMTDRFKYKRKALDEETVRGTWRRILREEDGLPANWVTDTSVPGVLVGMGQEE